MGLFDFLKPKNIKTEKQTIVYMDTKATKANKKIIEDYKLGNNQLATSGMENAFHTSELVFSAVDYIAKAGGQAIPRLYRLDKSGKKLPVKDKKLAEWEYRPNPFWSWGVIIELAVQGLLLSGVAPLTFENVKGNYETWFLTQPHLVQVVPDASKFIKGYIYNEQIAYKENELIWIINPTLNNAYYGLPSVAPLLDTLKLEKGAIDSLQEFYEGSVILAGILKAEYALTPQQIDDLRDQFNALYGKGGSERRGIAVLPAKMDYKTVQATPRDAMLLDSLDISEKRVLRVFKLNSLVLGGEDKSAGRPQELMKVVFNTAVRPYLYRIQDQINLFLGKQFGYGKYHFEFDFGRITELDTALDVKADSARTLFATGLATLNEARDLVDLPEMDFEGADKNIVPAFLTGSEAQFFQDLVAMSQNSSGEREKPTNIGSTDPLGGEPDLKV